jgi:hypothetical protein
MRRSSTTALIAMAVFLTTGCAVNEGRREATKERALQRTKTALISVGDADSLAAASLLSGWPLLGGWPKDQPLTRLELIERATAAAPDRPDLAWLHLQLCSQVETCDPKPIETQLHALDPANGAAWIGSLSRASKLTDTDEIQANILSIANTERFDIYWNPIIVHTTNAVIKAQTMDAATALVAAIGSAAAIAIPAYQQISNACKGEPLQRRDILANCRKVSVVLSRGDTYITQMIGLAIAKRAWPEGSAEYQGAVEAKRLAQYRMTSAARISTHNLWNKNDALNYLSLMATHRSEQDVALEEITKAGLDSNPPPDWTESQPGGR